MKTEKTGSVTLLGAGCGRGLLTCMGLKALQEAEVIVYDDLLDPALLEERSPSCELVYVGKRFERHSKKQEAISAILVEKAKEGKRVVRLKGGDSFVFGRGGEEVLALQEAQVPYRLIPGISSGIAVPENLGIPVTHRGVAQSVTMITGHSASETQENFEALAGLQGTLVFFMGLNSAEGIANRLMQYGKDPKTPAAILSCGFRANEKRTDCTLETLAEAAKTAETPALLLIGHVADLHMESTFDLPLKGVSVTVTGTRAFADKLEAELAAAGAFVEKCPTIRIKPDADRIPVDFMPYSWIVFTSSNGITTFFDTLKDRKTDLRKLAHLKFACIGTGTGTTLEKYGFYADFVPSDYTAQCMGRELPEVLQAEDRVLILRAENGSRQLNAGLDAASVSYEDRKIYHSAEMAADEVINQASYPADYIVFGSSMGAKAYLKHHTLAEKTKVVCIGEQTAEALQGYSVLMPQVHTAEHIVEVIMEDYHS